MKDDEYVEENGRLRVRRREELPPRARTKLAPDEYINTDGIVKRDPRIRKKLEAEPPKDFHEIVLEEESYASFFARVLRGCAVVELEAHSRTPTAHSVKSIGWT